MQKGFSLIIILVGVMVLAAVGSGVYFLQKQQAIKNIKSFEDCAKAGYPITAISPPTCRTPDGRIFTQILSEEEKKKLQPPQATSSADEIANWKIYVHPQLKYSLEYPPNWSGGEKDLRTTDYESYKDFQIFSPNFSGKERSTTGAIILVRAENTNKQSIEQFYNETLAKEIGKNKRDIVVNNQPTIQYDYSYEGVIATDTIFIRDNRIYLIKLEYSSLDEKDRWWNVYTKVLETFKIN